MIKRFTPLALLFGLLTALLLGSTSVAQANPLVDFQCNNVVGVGVVCENDVLIGVLNDVKIVISDNHVLNGNQINILENSLNNVDVDINKLIYIGNLEADVLSIYDSFDIDLDVGDVNVCIGVVLCK
ncbi:MAG: hypothetical protein ACRDSZ_14025 [Pseudonocardiaceae bacterium]